ncbi:MAG: hypothetical protein J0M12_13695 [Deltaproteobacteria bacterium]|nr:hypothetical protein [Deltaproteobacteria bacterium]
MKTKIIIYSILTLLVTAPLSAFASDEAKCTGSIMIESLIEDSKVLPQYAEVMASYNGTTFTCTGMSFSSEAKLTTQKIVLGFAPGINKSVAKSGANLAVELRNQMSGAAMFGVIEFEQQWLVMGELK